MGEISVEGLVKEFEDDEEGVITAVDRVNLDINAGEFVVLVGPSGCGKTTTLRCVAGLERVTQGTIKIGGEDVTENKPKNRNIAMVFQNYALYPHMTARENMAFGLKLNTALGEDEIEERVDQAAEMMGIIDLLDKKPSGLSGGQQQRVALGRAIVRDPAVFLMDEPLSNLDAKLRNQMRTELQDLQKELGVTTLYVTHDQVEAMTMADRIVILKDGKVQQIGSPLECYHRPANEFVAGFIGSPSMNFLDVTVSGDGEMIDLTHDTFETSISGEKIDFDPPSKAVLGIRPEDIELTTDSEADLSVTAAVVEPMGDETYVYFDVGEKRFTASFSGEELISEGDHIDIRFPQNRLYLFDSDSGETIFSRDVPEDADQKRLLE